MLWEVEAADARYLTLVVRGDLPTARRLARERVREYTGVEEPAVTLRPLDPDGLPGVLIEDAS